MPKHRCAALVKCNCGKIGILDEWAGKAADTRDEGFVFQSNEPPPKHRLLQHKPTARGLHRLRVDTPGDFESEVDVQARIAAGPNVQPIQPLLIRGRSNRDVIGDQIANERRRRGYVRFDPGRDEHEIETPRRSDSPLASACSSIVIHPRDRAPN